MARTKQENLDRLEEALKQTQKGKDIFNNGLYMGLIEGYFRAGVIDFGEYNRYSKYLHDLMENK